MGQQLLFEDRLKGFANDRREADGPELPLVGCAGVLRLGLLLRGANRQEPGQFEVKGKTSRQVQGKYRS